MGVGELALLQLRLVEHGCLGRILDLALGARRKEGAAAVGSKELARGAVAAHLHAPQLRPGPRIQAGRAVHALAKREAAGTYRTNVMCTPMLRCTEEQSRQMYTPNVALAHVGFFAPQSKQVCRVSQGDRARGRRRRRERHTYLVGAVCILEYLEDLGDLLLGRAGRHAA